MSNPKLTIGQRSQLLHDMHTFCVNIHKREIFLHSYADTNEEECMDYKMATMFAKNMVYLHSQNNNPILIHMHSPGGNDNDGWAIYDIIKNSNCYITIIAYAHASSMSSVVLQAADARVLLPSTEVLIHYGSVSLDATSVEAQSYMNAHKKSTKIMLDIYTERCKNGKFFVESDKSQRAIRQFINSKMINHQDWYLSAEEAVFYGFADHIIGCDKYPNITSCIQ